MLDYFCHNSLNIDSFISLSIRIINIQSILCMTGISSSFLLNTKFYWLPSFKLLPTIRIRYQLSINFKMDLFLDSSYRSFFLELISNYLQLVKEKKVNPIRLSSDTLKLVSEKDITFPSLPLLVLSGGKTLRSALSISLSLAEATFTKDILVGSKKEEQLAVMKESLL